MRVTSERGDALGAARTLAASRWNAVCTQLNAFEKAYREQELIVVSCRKMGREPPHFIPAGKPSSSNCRDIPGGHPGARTF